MVVVNLPVRDPVASADFYREAGFDVDEETCEDEAICLHVTDTVLVMLVSAESYARFLGSDDGVPARPADVARPALLSLAAASAAEVDDVVARALAAGGTPRAAATEGPLHARAFADPDGHVWELIGLNVALSTIGPEAQT
jgi:predicted lactoylglutathione lyase